MIKNTIKTGFLRGNVAIQVTDLNGHTLQEKQITNLVLDNAYEVMIQSLLGTDAKVSHGAVGDTNTTAAVTDDGPLGNEVKVLLAATSKVSDTSVRIEYLIPDPKFIYDIKEIGLYVGDILICRKHLTGGDIIAHQSSTNVHISWTLTLT